MSTIRADNISPVGSTLTLTAPVAGLSVAGGLTVGGIAFFSGGVTFNGLVTLTGGATSAAVISCGTAPTQGQHLANKTYVDGQAIGVGQSWVNVTGSRTSATTYTNNTGKPIMVSVSTTSTSNVSVYVSGVTIASHDTANAGPFNHSFVVPDGTTYSMTHLGTLRNWTELR
jgi:hypothetical protein